MSSKVEKPLVTTLSVAKSTTAGKNAAVVWFDKWLTVIGRGKLSEHPVDAISEDFMCHPSVLDAFAAWLLEQEVKKTNVYTKGVYPAAMEVSTILQYVSGVKESLKGLWPDNAMWKDEAWYTKIREAVDTYWRRRAIQQRDAFSRPEPPICNAEMDAMCKELMKACSGDNAGLEPLMRRALLVSTHYFAGRVGEGSFWSWEHLNWVKGIPVMNWPEMKTLELKGYCVVINPHGYENDLVHALASLYAVGAGSHNLPKDYEPESCGVLPFISDKNASKYVGEIIAGFAGKYDDKGVLVSGLECIDPASTAKSLRGGKVAEMMMDPSVDAYIANSWGGWADKGGSGGAHTTNMTYYVKMSLKMSLMAAKAGYGYANSRSKTSMYDWNVVTTEHNRKELEEYAAALFSLSTHVDLFKGRAHRQTRPFAMLMLASLLVHLDAVVDNYGPSHLLVRRMLEAGVGRTVGDQPITLTMLRTMGQQLRVKWESDNAVATNEAGDYGAIVAALSGQVGALALQNAKLLGELQTIKNLLQQQTVSQARTQTSPSRRSQEPAVASSGLSSGCESGVGVGCGAGAGGAGAGAGPGAGAGAGPAAKIDAFVLMTQSSAATGGGKLFLFPQNKNLTIKDMVFTFAVRGLAPEGLDWSGSTLVQSDKRLRKMGIGETVAASQARSRIKLAYSFTQEHILPRLSAADQAALSAKPPSAPSEAFVAWSKAFNEAAERLQNDALNYLLAREKLKKQEEVPLESTAAAVGAGAVSAGAKKSNKKKKGGKQVAASGPTLESTVSRIENLRGSIISGKGNGDKRIRCAGYLDRKLSTQEEAQLLGTAVMGSSAAAGDAEGEEEGEEEGDEESEEENEEEDTGLMGMFREFMGGHKRGRPSDT